MKKRILLLTLSVSLCALVFMSLFSTFIYHSNLVDSTVQHLKVYMLSYKQNKDKYTEKGFTHETARTLSEEVGGWRVTFIALDGAVLGDSTDRTITQNHMDRKEVSQALNEGSGMDVRSSATENKELIYYCEKFSEPDVLVRIAVTSSSVWDVLVDMLPLMITFILLDIGVCFALSTLVVRYVLRPVEEFGEKARDSDKLPLGAPYRELEPLAQILTSVKRDNASKIEEIKSEKMRETVVLDNMEHGIVILRALDDIILINKSAAKLLEYKESTSVLLGLARDKEVLYGIEERKQTLVYREHDAKFYAYRLSYVSEMDAMVLLITDVTAITRAEKVKDEFIANVTHEMNTPLTSISGYAELIATGKLSQTAVEKDANIIVSQASRLSKLIKSIINYSEIDHEDNACDISLTNIARASAQEFEPTATLKNVKIIFDGNENIHINACPTRALEVIDNLISNAIKYNKTGGSVTVRVAKTPNNKAVLTVADTGIGIARDKFDRIFDRFFTVDESHSSGGFGLGLATVKKLCRTYGWQIKVESALGTGTTMTVIF